ncbi:uncharacterized protein [Ranitomeya imitator]|uniref:uncharacterized protein n=1 Tax=Ranitomeya imitator TaxID=111125 RepID=UPI0037E8BE11
MGGGLALWDTREQQNSHAVVIRQLWNEVAQAMMDDWDNATSQKGFSSKAKTRWRSMKDRFNKDVRQEIQVRSGAAARLVKYKYHRVLDFLRPVLAQRTTWSSILKPGSSSGAFPHRTATDQSQPCTSKAAVCLHNKHAGGHFPGGPSIEEMEGRGSRLSQNVAGVLAPPNLQHQPWDGISRRPPHRINRCAGGAPGFHTMSAEPRTNKHRQTCRTSLGHIIAGAPNPCDSVPPALLIPPG